MKISLFRNIRFQTYLQITNTIIPLITTPYIARVLGSTQIGVYSVTTSVAAFFTLFEMLGTTSYGTRAIVAEVDEEKKKDTFAEIYVLQLFSCFIATACYSIYLFFCQDNKLIAVLQLITLVGYFFDVSWFYFGIEDFKTTVQWSFLFRILSFISLFIFVKKTEDLWIYTVIMLSSAALSQIVLWCLLIKKGYFRFGKIKAENVLRHLKPNLLLFVPLIAMTIYHSTDRIMLGMFSTYEQAGYYYNVDKVINVPFAVFTGMGTVMLPRMTAMFQEDERNAEDFFYNSLSAFMMLGAAICFGIIAIAKQFIPLFLGDGYSECTLLIIIFAPIILVKCVSNAIRMHYLIPKKLESIYIIATMIGAVINAVLNWILIPKLGASGAEITTIVSELVALIIQLAFIFDGKRYLRMAVDLLAYVAMGLLMVFILRAFDNLSSNMLMITTVKVFAGAMVYCLMTLVYWIVSGNRFYSLYVRPYLKRKPSDK